MDTSIPAYDWSMSIDANLPRLEMKLEMLADELRDARRANTDIILRVRRMLLERERKREMERAAKKSKAAAEFREERVARPPSAKPSNPSVLPQTELSLREIEVPRPLRSLLDDNRVLLANAEDASRETRERRRARRRSSALGSVTGIRRSSVLHENATQGEDGDVTAAIQQQRTEVNPFEKFFENVTRTSRARSVSHATIPCAEPNDTNDDGVPDSAANGLHFSCTPTDVKKKTADSEHPQSSSESESPRDDVKIAVHHQENIDEQDKASVSAPTTVLPSLTTTTTPPGTEGIKIDKESSNQDEKEMRTPPSRPSPSPTALSFGKYFEIVVGGGGDVVSSVYDAEDEQKDVDVTHDEVSSKPETVSMDDAKSDARNSVIEHGDHDEGEANQPSSTSDGGVVMDFAGAEPDTFPRRRSSVRPEKERDCAVVIAPEDGDEEEAMTVQPPLHADDVCIDDSIANEGDALNKGDEEAMHIESNTQPSEQAYVHRGTDDNPGENVAGDVDTDSAPRMDKVDTADPQRISDHNDTSDRDAEPAPRRLSLLVQDAMDVDAKCNDVPGAVASEEHNDVEDGGRPGDAYVAKSCAGDFSDHGIGESTSIDGKRAPNGDEREEMMMKGRERAFTDIAERNAVLEVENDILKMEREMCSVPGGAIKTSVIDTGAISSSSAAIIDIDNVIQEEENIFPGLHFSILE